jgi:MSHA biogenesis protein MshQ
MHRPLGSLATLTMLALVLALNANPADAVNFFSRQDGNWSANGTWTTVSCASNTAATATPGAADAVTICNDDTVAVNVTASALSLTIPTGANDASLTISNQTLTVIGDLTVTGASANGIDREILLSNNATLNVNGNLTLTGGTTNTRFALLDINGSTVNVGGTLTINGGAEIDRARVTMANTSALNVTGDIVIGAGGLLNNGNTNASVVSLRGDFTHSGAGDDYVSTGGVFQMVGTGAQAIDGATGITTAFFRLVINKASGDVTINHPVQIANAGTLTLTSGRIVTGASHVAAGVTAAATISGASTASYIIGNLRRYIPTGTQSGILYPVGGSTAGKFAQVQIDFPNVTTAGYFQVAASTGNTDQPNVASSALDSTRSVNRYWTLTNTGGLTFSGTTTASATFNYPASDIDGGATPTAFFVGDYSAGWTYPTMGTRTATSTQVTGLVTTGIAGDYAIAETVGAYSYWRMNEGAWNGTADEVADLGSANNPGTATTMTATPLPTTADTLPGPAIAGSPGTCRYGRFNRTNKNYVALPAGYPGLMASGQTGFSITAWINSTNTALPGQRIMIDDQNDTSPGAWGFSVGETDRNGAGGVRFYYRQATTVTIDTDPVPSNQWLFVALSVSLATGTNASRATIYVYNTGGTLIQTFTNTFTWTPGSDPGPPSIGGETNASVEGTNQFGFSGAIDELRVFRAALGQDMVNRVRQLVNPCDPTSHYGISGSTTAVTCDATTVQFTAHDAVHGLVTPAAGTVINLTTSTNTGVWQGLQTGTGTWLPSNLNDGKASYNWPGGQASFSVTLRHNTVATLNINATDSNGKAEFSAEDLSIAFTDTAFRVVTNATTPALIGTQLSAKNSDVGFGSQPLKLQAIRTDTNTGSCVGLIQGKIVTIEMAAARVNPAAAPSNGSVVRVRDNTGTLIALGTGSGGAGAYTNVTLAFDASSMAPLVVNYADAGSISLFARYQLPSPPSGIFVLGSSNTFVVRPFGFRIAGPPSGRTGPTDPVYARAGATWPDPVTVSAVVWEAADDLNDDGVPDNDTVLTGTPGNAVTTNFGKESTAATVSLTHALAAPSGGTNGTLTTSLSTFNNGAASTSASWSEVGLINLLAISSNYLGSSQNIRNSMAGYAGVGRFYPDHFFVAGGSTLTNRSAVVPACSPASSFTYMDEPFKLNFTLQARNTAGVVTENYVGGFAKLNPPTTGHLGFGALSGTTDLSLRLDAATTSTSTFANGAAIVETVLDLNRQSSADGPFPTVQIGIAPVDSDAVALRAADLNMNVTAPPALDHQQIGASTDIRFGRMRLQSAMGSASLDLPLVLRTEYFNGAGFATNAADSCTTILASNIRYAYVAGTTLAACETATNPAVNIYFNGGQASAAVPPAAVVAPRLTKPGAANNGAVDLSVNLNGLGGNTCTAVGAPFPLATSAAMPWLQGAWNGATYTDNPRGRYTFGSYKAADQFIYLQENY